ncbi:hypothetical protein RUM44_007912 [Polyplax serrata]|uniref:Uncharacterized protein n=1 Tax=Polyplax serrata TaxID=468196 RepID=A0ABR1BAT2_POLSC
MFSTRRSPHQEDKGGRHYLYTGPYAIITKDRNTQSNITSPNDHLQEWETERRKLIHQTPGFPEKVSSRQKVKGKRIDLELIRMIRVEKEDKLKDLSLTGKAGVKAVFTNSSGKRSEREREREREKVERRHTETGKGRRQPTPVKYPPRP